MKALLLLFLLSLSLNFANADLPNECKLEFGTNISGVSDWGTEIPFTNLMHVSRTWYTKSVDDPDWLWNSGMAQHLSYREDGYPTHIPQSIPESIYQQRVATIWAITDAWKPGKYVVLWDGTGELDFWGGDSDLEYINDNKLTFNFNNPVGNLLELIILSSDINDPVRNIRIIHEDYEENYDEQFFNPVWLEKVSIFRSLRFMDWGRTNNWGLDNHWEWEDTTRVNWEGRAKLDYYTWTGNKGIPYEIMIKLMNEHGFDGWVCVPHIASDEYIEKMAQLFRDNLNSDIHLTVEYSNEIWNWMFAQTQWLNKYGCVDKGISWPEGIAPYAQNCLDIWTDVFEGQLSRITRIGTGQTGWLDVSQRIIFNMDTSKIDAISPTFYFGLSDEADAELDALGENATVQDVATRVRENLDENKFYIENMKTIADSLNVPLVFYEGGQHITPHPFGEEPTYAQALIDIHRDSSMYNLYNEWFDFLRTLQSGDEPMRLMNFSFVAQRSARYGSWGILETMDQDTSEIPAPKFKAIMEAMEGCDNGIELESQTISLNAGWNFISTYINPQIANIESIYSDISDNITIVKNGNAETFIPSLNVNSIGNWNIEHGYKVHSRESEELQITGEKIIPENIQIELSSGWNLIPYLRDNSLSSETAFDELLNEGNLLLAKNQKGKIFAPSFEINNLGDLMVGEAYMLYVFENDILTYKENSFSKSTVFDYDSMPVNFQTEFSNTGSSMNLFILGDFADDNEIGVFDEQEQLIGSGVFKNGKAVLTVWGDNEYSEVKDGAFANENLYLKIFGTNINLNDISTFTDMTSNNNIEVLQYRENSIISIDIDVANSIFENGENVFAIYPNPVDSKFNINTLHKTKVNTLLLRDLTGRVIIEFDSESVNFSEISFDVSSLASGIYILELNTDEKRYHLKIVKM